MDILYVVGKGSMWHDNELRFSLRSIAKYGRNVDRVFLVGYKPDFVSDEVHYLPCDDPYERAHKNILHKVLYAIENTDIAPHFLVSSDDHFYIRDTDFNALPVYYRRRDIPESIPQDHKTNPYFYSLVETRELLLRYGLPTYQTNPHCNTHFDVDVYRQHKDIFADCFSLPHGGEMNCVMGNLLIAAGAEPEEFHDSKVSRKFCTSVLFNNRIGDTNCVSGVPYMAGSYLAKWLARNFNEKSIYEI